MTWVAFAPILAANAMQKENPPCAEIIRRV
jgi:hypothetical protein